MIKKHTLSLVIILSFSLFGIKALFHPGLYTAHDIWHQVARLYHYYQAVTQGQLPPYWITSLANGFGYPLFFFSYHFPWLLALPFLFAGLTIPVTIKLLFILSFIFSGMAMYLLTFQASKSRLGAITSAILYLYLPIHLRVILVSAAMGVAWVFVFAPLFILGIYKLHHNLQSRSGFLLITLSTTGLILSHLISLPALAPLLITVFLILLSSSARKKPFFTQTTRSIFLGLGISAFYLLPALFYQPAIQAGSSSLTKLYQTGFLSFKQLIYSPWGYGIIGNNIKTAALSFQLGIAHWGSILLAILLLIKHRKFHLLTTALLLVFALNIFLMLDYSRPVWEVLTSFLPLDFPTRFLFSATFIATFLAGLSLSRLKQPFRLVASFGLIAIALYTNRNHLRVNEYTNIPISLYIDSELTTNSFHEYLPTQADQTLLSQKNLTRLPLHLNLDKQELVSFNHFAFPGVQLLIDQKPTDYTTDQRGRIKALVPAGEHQVDVIFQSTLIIRLAQLVSALSLLIVIMYPWPRQKRKK